MPTAGRDHLLEASVCCITAAGISTAATRDASMTAFALFVIIAYPHTLCYISKYVRIWSAFFEAFAGTCGSGHMSEHAAAPAVGDERVDSLDIII